MKFLVLQASILSGDHRDIFFKHITTSLLVTSTCTNVSVIGVTFFKVILLCKDLKLYRESSFGFAKLVNRIAMYNKVMFPDCATKSS